MRYRRAVTLKPRIEKAYKWWMTWTKRKLTAGMATQAWKTLIEQEDLEFDLSNSSLDGKSYSGWISPHPENVVAVTGTLANELALYLSSMRHEIVGKDVDEWSSVIRSTLEQRALDFLDNVRNAAEDQGLESYADILDEANNPVALLAALAHPRLSEDVRDLNPNSFLWLIDLGVPWEELRDEERVVAELQDLDSKVKLGLTEDLYSYAEPWLQDRAEELSPAEYDT